MRSTVSGLLSPPLRENGLAVPLLGSPGGVAGHVELCGNDVNKTITVVGCAEDAAHVSYVVFKQTVSVE